MTTPRERYKAWLLPLSSGNDRGTYFTEPYLNMIPVIETLPGDVLLTKDEVDILDNILHHYRDMAQWKGKSEIVKYVDQFRDLLTRKMEK